MGEFWTKICVIIGIVVKKDKIIATFAVLFLEKFINGIKRRNQKKAYFCDYKPS